MSSQRMLNIRPLTPVRNVSSPLMSKEIKSGRFSKKTCIKPPPTLHEILTFHPISP